MSFGSLKSLSREEVARLATLSAVGKTLNTSTELASGLEGVLDSVMTALSADRGFIELLSPTLTPIIQIALDKSKDPWGRRFSYTQTLYQECLAQKEPLMMLDAAGDSASESAVTGSIRSVMLHPILSQDRLVGVLYLDNLLKAGQFHLPDLELLGIIADMVAVFLERSQSTRALAKKSKELEKAIGDVREANRLLADSAHETIFKLSVAAEFRDDECGEHVQRVSLYSEAIALKMGLPAEMGVRFRFASQLHDVGKVGIPDSVLLKPGRYTDYEREIMKQHTLIGAKILSGSQNLTIRLAEEIALTHHEKWDGTGYPRGLAGNKIPLSGRIVAVADVFDALTTERRYKAAWTNERAFELVAKEAGSHFDPEVARAFLALAEEVADIRERHQPRPLQPDSVEVSLPELPLRTRAEGREKIPSLRKAVEDLSHGDRSGLAGALKTLRELESLLQGQGENCDAVRRLIGHVQKEELSPEQAPRLAELLGEVEKRLAEEAVTPGGYRILLLDSDPRHREALVIEAGNRGYSIVEAPDVLSADRAMLASVPDLLMLEILEADADAFLERFCHAYPDIPVVVFSAEGSFSRRLEVARKGCKLYLHKPLPASAVFEEVRQRIWGKDLERAKLLALDDDKVVLKVIERSLSSQGFEVVSISDSQQLWGALAAAQPDLLLLDWEMPGVSGEDVCTVLRSDPRFVQLPIIVLTSHDDAETYDAAFRAGADDLLCKPLDAVKMARRIRSRLKRDFALRKGASRDPLTGLINRRTAMRVANHLFSLAVRNNASFSLCSVRVEDYAKLVSQQGAMAAREIIRKVAMVLGQRSRSEDLLVRYRDDCFLLGLYGSTVEATEQGLSSLNARLAQEEPSLKCISHLANYPRDGTDLNTLLEKIHVHLDQG